MRIGDAAAAAGTTPRALRLYEANGLLPAPRRTASGQRVYGHREVVRLRVIRELLGLGLTIADLRGCADRLDLLDGETLPPYGEAGACADPAGIAARRIAALDAEIARLTALRDGLAARTTGEEAGVLASDQHPGLPLPAAGLAEPRPAGRRRPALTDVSRRS